MWTKYFYYFQGPRALKCHRTKRSNRVNYQLKWPLQKTFLSSTPLPPGFPGSLTPPPARISRIPSVWGFFLEQPIEQSKDGNYMYIYCISLNFHQSTPHMLPHQTMWSFYKIWNIFPVVSKYVTCMEEILLANFTMDFLGTNRNIKKPSHFGSLKLLSPEWCTCSPVHLDVCRNTTPINLVKQMLADCLCLPTKTNSKKKLAFQWYTVSRVSLKTNVHRSNFRKGSPEGS